MNSIKDRLKYITKESFIILKSFLLTTIFTILVVILLLATPIAGLIWILSGYDIVVVQLNILVKIVLQINKTVTKENENS